MDLVQFYQGTAPDYKGRTLRDLWAWDDERLEDVHDFIQVLFPLDEPSRVSARAPLLDDATIERFRQDETIQANLLKSFRRMLAFYGFRLDEMTKELTKADNFAERAANWLVIGDHNHLRITRILKCLTLCGLDEYAAAFLKALREVADDNAVSKETLWYWKNAVSTGGSSGKPN
jgi:hypothetical protein